MQVVSSLNASPHIVSKPQLTSGALHFLLAPFVAVVLSLHFSCSHVTGRGTDLHGRARSESSPGPVGQSFQKLRANDASSKGIVQSCT